MNPLKRQHGGIAILLVLLLATTTLAALARVSGMRDPVATNQKHNIDSLAQAREALLNYVTVGNGNLSWDALKDNATLAHARLPCPDIDGNGLIDGVDTALCGAPGQSVLGLFPWQELGTPPLMDGSGNCLWYAVSGSHKLENSTAGINGDSNGSFTIVDAQFAIIATNVVAVIIAPGAALSWQNRAGAANNVPCPVPGANAQGAAGLFLDSTANPAGGVPIDHASLVTGISPAAFFMLADQREALAGTMNDQIAWITAEEYAAFASRHAAEMIQSAWAPALQNFFNAVRNWNGVGHYPRPALVPGGTCSSTSPNGGFLPTSCVESVPKYYTCWWDGYPYTCVDWKTITLSLPNISMALTNDRWPEQTHYTLNGATLDGVARTVPLILLRSRPINGQSCTGATLLDYSNCVEGGNQAAVNGTRQYSTPNARTSNDSLRVMQ